MYAKIIIALCAVSFAHAGGLYGAAPLAYSAPIVTKTVVSPAVSSVSAYSTHQTHPAPVATYAAAPIVAKTYAAPVAVAAPVIAKAYAAPAYGAYAAPAYGAYAAPAYGAYAAPAYGAYAAPGYSAYSTPLISKAYTYAAAAPIVSNVAYGGYGGW